MNLSEYDVRLAEIQKALTAGRNGKPDQKQLDAIVKATECPYLHSKIKGESNSL
ncbi:MAG: hypothetical protein WBA74_00150 [Cyclobacteriaceae bacterium]